MLTINKLKREAYPNCSDCKHVDKSLKWCSNCKHVENFIKTKFEKN